MLGHPEFRPMYENARGDSIFRLVSSLANAPKSVLIPLDDITGVVVQANNVLDIHCVGAHAATQLWKCTPTTDQGGAAAPTITSGDSVYDALISAMTANPGGVASSVILGNDQAATPVQMYWRSVAFTA